MRVMSGRSRPHAPDFVPQYPGDGADRRHVELVAHSVVQEAVPDLPGEDPRIFLLEVLDVGHHFGGGHPRFGASDGAREDAARLVVPGQDLGDAAVGHPQLPADVAGPDP